MILESVKDSKGLLAALASIRGGGRMRPGLSRLEALSVVDELAKVAARSSFGGRGSSGSANLLLDLDIIAIYRRMIAYLWAL